MQLKVKLILSTPKEKMWIKLTKIKMHEFFIQLNANHYTDFSSMHTCLAIKIKSKANNANDIAVETILLTNFFANWFKDIDIKRYRVTHQLYV